MNVYNHTIMPDIPVSRPDFGNKWEHPDQLWSRKAEAWSIIEVLWHNERQVWMFMISEKEFPRNLAQPCRWNVSILHLPKPEFFVLNNNLPITTIFASMSCNTRISFWVIVQNFLIPSDQHDHRFANKSNTPVFDELRPRNSEFLHVVGWNLVWNQDRDDPAQRRSSLSSALKFDWEKVFYNHMVQIE